MTKAAARKAISTMRRKGSIRRKATQSTYSRDIEIRTGHRRKRSSTAHKAVRSRRLKVGHGV